MSDCETVSDCIKQVSSEIGYHALALLAQCGADNATQFLASISDDLDAKRRAAAHDLYIPLTLDARLLGY